LLKAVAKDLSEKPFLFRMVAFMEDTKGVCLVRKGKEQPKYYRKINYLRMKRAGRDVELIEEALTLKELKEKLGRV